MIEEKDLVVPYVDHSRDTPKPGLRDRAKTWFLNRLYGMLEDADTHNIAHIISWQNHSRSFVIHDNKKLQAILPNYFNITKTSSFLRQLNIYGFSRIVHGPDAGGYYHERFLRGMRWLAQTITPFKVKGTGIRQKSKPHPDFSVMDPIVFPSFSHSESKALMTQDKLPPGSTSLPRSLSVVSNEEDHWMVPAFDMPMIDSVQGSLNHLVDTTPLMEELISGEPQKIDHVDYSKNTEELDWHWEEDEVQSAMYDLVHKPAGISFDRFLQDLAFEERIQN
jgi:hypothetical protein